MCPHLRLARVADALHVGRAPAVTYPSSSPLSTCAAAAEQEDQPRYRPADLRRFGAALLERAGMEISQAEIVASSCVEGDLLNHSTHGMRLLPAAIGALQSGAQVGMRSVARALQVSGLV